MKQSTEMVFYVLRNNNSILNTPWGGTSYSSLAEATLAKDWIEHELAKKDIQASVSIYKARAEEVKEPAYD